MLLIIDNYDSFTYNLVQRLGEIGARIEQVRMPSIPFVNIGSGKLAEGDALGRLPLLAFRPEELNRDGVIYQPTELSVGTFGVRVALVPK